MFLRFLYLCAYHYDGKVTRFRFESKFFALLPKYHFFEIWSTEELSVIFLEEKGFKIFVTFAGLLKSSLLVTADTIPSFD